MAGTAAAAVAPFMNVVTSASARWRVVLLAALTAVLSLLLPAVPAVPASAPAVETRVGAIKPAAAVVVGVHECVTAGQRPVRGPSQLQIVVGNCVAAEAGAGPGSRLRGRIGDLADDTGAIGGGNRLTNSQATDLATWLGYRPAGRLRVKNQQVFTNGKDYIVQDIDSHLPAGLWKRGGSYEDLFSKRTRMGTYDYELNRIGP
jgi:hypothetical protein